MMNALQMFTKKAKGKKGFTLVELVIVIAVLAIIAAIAIPSVTGVIKNANEATDKSNAQALSATIKTYVAEIEASTTNTIAATDPRRALHSGSTLDELLACYGMTTPTIKTTGVFAYNTKLHTVTVKTSVGADEISLVASTTIGTQMGLSTLGVKP